MLPRAIAKSAKKNDFAKRSGENETERSGPPELGAVRASMSGLKVLDLTPEGNTPGRTVEVKAFCKL